MLKLEKHIGQKAEEKQREMVKAWKDDIRWINGYTYRNVKLKFKGLKVAITVNVPWAKTMDEKHGTFKNREKLGERVRRDWEVD